MKWPFVIQVLGLLCFLAYVWHLHHSSKQALLKLKMDQDLYMENLKQKANQQQQEKK